MMNFVLEERTDRKKLGAQLEKLRAQLGDTSRNTAAVGRNRK